LTPQTRASLSYNFSNTFTKDATDGNDETANQAVGDSLDQQTQTIFGEISSQVNDSLILSVLGNISSTEYSEEIRNDNRQYGIGPQITHVSKSGFTSSVYLAIDQLDFDTTNNPGAQDSQSTNLNLQSSISFIQSNFMSHTFSLNHQQEPSNATTSNQNDTGETIPANFQTSTIFGYNLNYPLNKQLNIGLSYSFGQIEESDGGNDYYQETVSLGLPYQLNARTSVSARYNYLRTFGSRFTEFNYDQHVVEISFRLDI
ncbi:MAG: hypothetical protein AB8B56_08635, partial [Crocinitomicaceae bacterium]